MTKHVSKSNRNEHAHVNVHTKLADIFLAQVITSLSFSTEAYKQCEMLGENKIFKFLVAFGA